MIGAPSVSICQGPPVCDGMEESCMMCERHTFDGEAWTLHKPKMN